MSRVLYVDCVGGVAGDMLLAALLDAGADAGAIGDGLARLGVAGLALERSDVHRHGIRAARAIIRAGDDQPARGWAEIRDQIEAAELPERASERAQEAFRRLAHAEARVHGIDPEAVHFHEVGAADAIGEVCGVALALEDVEVLAARPAPATEAGAPQVAATLRVTVRQAVYLTAAAAFAREIRLLARAPGDRRRTGPISLGADLR